MSMYADQEDAPVAAEVVPQMTPSTHREQVYKGIKEGLIKHFKEIAEKDYQTTVDVTKGDKPLELNVNIKTNDPRIIAALAAAGGV